MNKLLMILFICMIFMTPIVSASWESSNLSVGLISYYKLDENAANTFVLDNTGKNNGTASVNTNVLSAPGLIGTSFDFNNAEDVDLVNAVIPTSGTFSINAWVNFTTTDRQAYLTQTSGGAGRLTLYHYRDGNVAVSLGGSRIIEITINLADGNWHMMTVTRDSSDNFDLWIDNDFKATANSALNIDNAGTHISDALTEPINGDGEEFGFWNITLSNQQIENLYNSGAGLTFPIASFEVVLNSPEDFANLSLSEVEFNGTVIAGGGLTIVNISLFDDSSGTFERKQTKTLTGTINSTTFNSTFIDGTHTWDIESCNNLGDCIFSSANRTFSVDTSVPTFSDFSDNSGNLTFNGTATFNVNVINTNGSVLLEYNGTNYTATNLTANEYNVSIILVGDNSSIRNYTWHSWSSGFFNLPNSSAPREYLIFPVNRICFNTTHPDYPDKFLCSAPGVNTLNFTFNITYFRNNIFANNSNFWSKTYSGEENQTVDITMHKYDEIDNLSMKINGSNGPQNVLFYGMNNSIIDRYFPGYLQGSNIFTNLTQIFQDGNYVAADSINLPYSNKGEKIIYFWMDDNAVNFTFEFNLSAEAFGITYFNDFSNNFSEDPLQTDTLLLGGYILPKGDNLKEFVFDNFNDSSIGLDNWVLGIPNGHYFSSEGDTQYEFTINNKEENNYLEMEINSFEVNNLGTTGSASVNNFIYANLSRLNSWTPQNIYFEIDYLSTGREEDQTNKCDFYHEFVLGDINVWRSNIYNCESENNGDFNNCISTAEITENLVFNLTRQINNSWLVQITGVEENSGRARFLETDDCGTLHRIYNYTSGVLHQFYENPVTSGPEECNDPSDVFSDLNNSYIIEGLTYNIINQFHLSEFVSGSWNHDFQEGCDKIDTWGRINYLNQTLYDLSNGTFISESIYDSSGDISTATYNGGALNFAGELDLNVSLSADDGLNWEEISDSIPHAFVNVGRHLRHRINMNLRKTGYLTDSPVIVFVNITTPKGNPENITFDFGDDGIIDFLIPGEFNATNGTISINLSSADLTTEFLRDPTNSYQHLHAVPLVISSDSVGQINLEKFNLTYNPNPIILNTSFVQIYLNNLFSIGFENISFNVESTGGTISFDNLKHDYAGGNDTINVTIYQDNDPNNNANFLIHTFYSRWDYEFVPSEVGWLAFTPSSPTDKNVTPYGQSDSTPIFNLTNFGYGGKNANLTILMNDSLSCVNITMSLTNNKSDGILLDESFLELNSSVTYLQNTSVWMFADFNCSYSTWRLFDPYFYFRQCCEDCICSEEV